MGRAGRLHWLHDASGGVHWVEWSCELVGTALLVFGGLSAVTLDFGRGSFVPSTLPSVSARLALTGTLFASCGSLIAISPLGRRSGAHLNPAVTVAFWLRGHLHRHDLLGYVLSQFAGATVGVLLLRLAWSGMAASVHYGLTRPRSGLGPWMAAAIEAAMTALMIFTIFMFVSSARTAKWTPLAALVVIAVLVWKGAPYTGTSLNPARSFGPALVSGDWHDYWVYVIGPLAGAGLAVAAFAALPKVTLTAKLFHDPRYRSVFASHLPARAGGGEEGGPRRGADRRPGWADA